jgi:poly(A) polymerase
MDDNTTPGTKGPDGADSGTPHARPEPVVLDRSRHSISRRDIDPDALKVLYRLDAHGFIAYLVGGAVRDLLLGRKPADFDIATDAHPNQIKKLFRNAFLIGRRFRLAHIRFQGGKIIEVSTFRRKPGEEELAAERAEEEERLHAQAEGGRREEAAPAEVPGAETGAEEAPEAAADAEEPAGPEGAPAEPAPEGGPEFPHEPHAGHPGRRPPIKPIAFGTPEEDAFRRDLTINALFYDIATYSVIDYVGGLHDLDHGLIRTIGDPTERYTEDPVRIWRVIRHASRLGFTIEEATAAAIPERRDLLAAGAGSRLYEELNKDMKSGAARPFFELARRYSILPIILGGIGALYQESGEAFGRLVELLSTLDAAVRRGQAPRSEVAYSLLFWPWAEDILIRTPGDKPRILFDAYREMRPAATIPKSTLIDVFQALAILDTMVAAMGTGRMKWALKKRAHYALASSLFPMVTRGAAAEDADPFERIFGERFGPAPGGGKPRRKHRRRRRPGGAPKPAA